MSQDEENKTVKAVRGATQDNADDMKQPDNVISEEVLESLLRKAGNEKKVPRDGEPAPAQFADLGGGRPAAAGGSIDMLMDVTLSVRIELGRTRMSVEDILNLQGDSVVTLEKLAGDFVDVLVNDKLVARGEVLILNDHFCVRIAEIVSPEERQDASVG